MYQFTYADIVDDAPSVGRAREHALITRSIELMRLAEIEGAPPRASVEAVHFTQRLWCVLIEDLAKPENTLPAKLRADLISIGLWILREAEGLRHERKAGFRSLIEVSSTIAEGIK